MRVFIVLVLAFLCGPAVAQFNGCQTGFCTTVPVSISSTTTWNPSDKDPGITLSGGNLVATSSTTLANCTVTGWCAVRAIASHSSGKFYYEVVVTTLGTAAHDEDIGVGNSTAVLNNHLGITADSGGLLHAGGVTFAGGCTPSGFVSGDVVSVAIDITAKLMWFRTNAGNWNNNALSNPATGANGCDFSTLNAGPYFPMINGSNDANTVFTANFGGSAYAESVPSGFGNW